MKAMEIKRILFSLMLVNLLKKNILNFLIATLAEMLGALRKKQLAVSFAEHFEGNHENAAYVYFAEVI